MLMKWLKKFFPSSEIKESKNDIRQTLDDAKKATEEAHETVQKAKVAIVKYSQASEEVVKEIDKNGFALFLKYNKHRSDENK